MNHCLLLCLLCRRLFLFVKIIKSKFFLFLFSFCFFALVFSFSSSALELSDSKVIFDDFYGAEEDVKFEVNGELGDTQYLLVRASDHSSAIYRDGDYYIAKVPDQYFAEFDTNVVAYNRVAYLFRIPISNFVAGDSYTLSFDLFTNSGFWFEFVDYGCTVRFSGDSENTSFEFGHNVRFTRNQSLHIDTSYTFPRDGDYLHFYIVCKRLTDPLFARTSIGCRICLTNAHFVFTDASTSQIVDSIQGGVQQIIDQNQANQEDLLHGWEPSDDPPSFGDDISSIVDEEASISDVLNNFSSNSTGDWKTFMYGTFDDGIYTMKGNTSFLKCGQIVANMVDGLIDCSDQTSDALRMSQSFLWFFRIALPVGLACLVLGFVPSVVGGIVRRSRR